jgi:hypothetical protein
LQGCGSGDGDPSAATAGAGGRPLLGEAGAESGGSAGSGSSGGGGMNTLGGRGTSEAGEAGMPPVLGAAGTPDDGEPGVGGANGDGQPKLCDEFCADEARICTGALEQYTDLANCLAECAGWRRGLEGDTVDNTLDCRIYHLAAAAGPGEDDATTHCPHTGAHPAFFCKD